MLNLNIIKSETSKEIVNSEDSLSPSLMLASIVLIFISFGLIMLYSTSSGNTAAKETSLLGFKIGSDLLFFIKQGMWAGVGAVGAFSIYAVGFKTLAKYSNPLLILAIAGLTAALFFPEINGAKRWIRLPGMSIQPSEFAKIALIIYLAQFLAKKQRFIDSFFSMVPAFCWVGGVIFLIILGEDLGTTLLLSATVWIMFFVAGMRIWWLLAPVIIGVPPLAAYIYFFDPMRMARLLSFLDPESVNERTGYQLWHSLLALGSGGWTGLGFTKSRMKAMYLPEAHTDFILSIVGEELGVFSLILIVAGYACIMGIGLWISSRTKNKALMLLGVGATSLITLQAIINLGVVSGALPTKGMPAPFISYGGSNMFMSLCCVGLLLCIEKETKKERSISDN
jgi:cell division protein FtsW